MPQNKRFFEAFLARVRSKKNTFRFTQNNHISFYQSGTFRFAGLMLYLFDVIHHIFWREIT